jgi:hypothetical protein
MRCLRDADAMLYLRDAMTLMMMMPLFTTLDDADAMR